MIPWWEDLLKDDMATHCSILAWRIPMDRGDWWATVHGVTKSQTLPMDRGDWWATVHGVTKSQTQLSD